MEMEIYRITGRKHLLYTRIHKHSLILQDHIHMFTQKHTQTQIQTKTKTQTPKKTNTKNKDKHTET